MAIYEIKSLPGEALSTRLASTLSRFAFRAIDARDARRTRRALADLSDELLDDIGLARSDIPAASRARR